MGSIVAESIASVPPNLRPIVTLFFENLADQGIALPDEAIATVARLVACSEFGAKVLLRESSWFVANVVMLEKAPAGQQLDDFVTLIAASDADIASVKSELRRFRNRQYLHILWREIQQQSDLDETLQQLSLMADRLLDAATRYAERQLEPRFGRVRNAAGEVVPLVVVGMGKLGGRELNFSSDIDIIFCYSEDGETDGERKQSAQEYFARLSRQIIALLDELTVDGFVFRVDTRLRPFGDSGPPVVSFAALESYLLQHGRDWERYAYIKARIVGSEPPEAIARELYTELIRPFVYRRYLDYGVFESLREMQEMIATEVRRRDLVDNIKLGPGGIREAEFIVQALQLVRGGSEPELQCRELQAVLPLLVSDRGISDKDAGKIRSAYRYMRRLENFIQAIRDEQTHDLPENTVDRERLCLAMRSNAWDELLEELDGHRNVISEQFSAIAFRGEDSEKPGREVFFRLWETGASAADWSAELLELAEDHADALADQIVTFRTSSATQQIDSIARRRLRTYVPKLLNLVVESKRPVSALSRTLAVTERILRR